MTGKPGQITSEIKLEHQKPRGEEFLLSKEFINYKREILNILHED